MSLDLTCPSYLLRVLPNWTALQTPRGRVIDITGMFGLYKNDIIFTLRRNASEPGARERSPIRLPSQQAAVGEVVFNVAKKMSQSGLGNHFTRPGPN